MPSDTPYTPFAPPASSNFVQQLRQETAGVRLSVKRFGVRRALTVDQIARAAEPFGTDVKFLNASKKLIDTQYEPYKAVTKAVGMARTYWNTMSIDYPISGIRLIRKSLVSTFDEQMKRFNNELQTALIGLEQWYGAMREEARIRLGDLFNEADYPASIRHTFSLEWDFPSVEPPDYLKTLNPELWEKEQKRVQAMFDEAISLAEQKFAVELQELVSHMVERLSGESDGKPKTFRDSAVKNMNEFFERFKTMNVTSNKQLEDLVADAQRLMEGVDPNKLRKDLAMRQTVAGDLTKVQEMLDSMIVNKPTRAIDLSDEPEPEAPAQNAVEPLAEADAGYPVEETPGEQNGELVGAGAEGGQAA